MPRQAGVGINVFQSSQRHSEGAALELAWQSRTKNRAWEPNMAALTTDVFANCFARSTPHRNACANPELGKSVERSYWQMIGGMPVNPAPTSNELPARATYVIVGGGFAGLSTALRMKEMSPDADIVLIEAKTVGYGASGRNGGLMSPLPAPVWLTTALNNPSHARALGMLNRKVADAAKWVANLAPQSEIAATELALEATGCVTDAGLAQVSATLTTAGIAHSFATGMTGNGPRSLRIAANTVNPYKLVLGLAAAARARGIRIVEYAPVANISDQSGNQTTSTCITLQDGRTIVANRVVITTNAYTSSIALNEQPRAKVVHNYMLATKRLAPETLSRLQRTGRASGRFVVELNAAYVFYRIHDGRLVFGGIEKLRQVDGGDLDVPTAVMKGLKKHLADTLDGLTLPEIEQAWGGRFHMTSTDLPIIRRSAKSPSIIYNVGYGGTGVALTLSLAPVAAALALGEPIEDAELAEIYATMCSTGLPVVGALRFAAGVIAAYVSQRWARRPGNIAKTVRFTR